MTNSVGKVKNKKLPKNNAMLKRIKSKLQFRVKNPCVTLTCLQQSLTADRGCKFSPSLAWLFILFLGFPFMCWKAPMRSANEPSDISFLSSLSDRIFLGHKTKGQPVTPNPDMGNKKGRVQVAVAQTLQSPRRLDFQ